ncbi:hypothetical protein DFJ74DRAFT_684735 [Hyaloraphidium curvatum]|nr:hypothetical protein DFJ74DRAFT_684735 [Hyaloraphidium curvatum]
MANATSPSSGPGLADRLSDFHMAFVNMLLPTFGEWLTYTLMQYILLKIIGVTICWTFEIAEEKGWWRQYRIQPHRNLSKEYIADEWDKFIGKQAVVGFFLVVLPMYWASYHVHRFLKGGEIGVGVDPRDTELRWGWGLWWRIAAAIYIDDTVLFVMHVIIHKTPWLYRLGGHKFHHEQIVNRPLVTNHISIGDLILQARFADLMGTGLMKLPWHGCMVYYAITTYMGYMIHCGYDLPFEPYNALIWPGPAVHEHHHITFKNSYQAYLPGLDWLFGYDKAFWKWNAERKRRMKEGTWYGEEGKAGVRYVQDVDKQDVVVQEAGAGKAE